MTSKKHDDDTSEHTVEQKRAAPASASEAPPVPFPYSASLNEPQTVSLPCRKA